MEPVTREDWNEMEALGCFQGVSGTTLYEFDLENQLTLQWMMLPPRIHVQSSAVSRIILFPTWYRDFKATFYKFLSMSGVNQDIALYPD